MPTYHIFALAFILTGLAACKSSNTEPTHPSEPTAQQPNEPQNNEPTTVLLTAAQLKTIAVKIGAVEQKELVAQVKANGVIGISNEHKSLITSQFGGMLKSVLVHTGDIVKAGQVVATITNPEFINTQEEYLTVKSQLGAGNGDAVASVANAQYAALQEQFISLQPQIELAEKEAQRQKELSAGNAGSAKNLEQALANLATLQSKRSTLQTQMDIFSKNANLILQTKRAALDAKLRLMGIDPKGLSPETMQSALSVRAVSTGVVGDIRAKIGTFVDASNVIAEVADLNNLFLDLNVYEADLHKFKLEQQIHFTLINVPDRTYAARIYRIGSALDPMTKSVKLHAHIEGSHEGLIEGMNAVAVVDLGKSQSAAVPNQAIVNHSNQNYIFVVRASNAEETIFEKIPVKLGTTEGNYTAISLLKPLPDNAQVAIEQAFFILGKMTNTGEE
jgi:membrane fusion protein, heavy metal efflux system